MSSRSRPDNPRAGDIASHGKIFIGGLAKDTTHATFNKHFGNYGDIVDSVIMKDRFSGHPRGFGFITYADPSVVDKVIEDTHVINGKQVEIKRTIPKGSANSRDFKTKKIFVGGIPPTVTEDEFRSFFSEYGKVVEQEIIRDHETNRPRGFGFIIFESEEVVEELLSQGNRVDLAGTQVEIKKAEPKKTSNPPPGPAYGSNSRARSFNDSNDGFGNYGSFKGGYRRAPYRTLGFDGRTPGFDGRFGGYGYGSSSEFAAGYAGFGGGSFGSYSDESSFGYSGRFGPYGAGFGVGFTGSGYAGYGQGGEGYGNYGGSGYGGGYDFGRGASHGGASGLYGKGGYGSSRRYHPYDK